MSNISRRINTIEKKLKTGKHQEQPHPTIAIAVHRGRKMTADERQKLGPVDTWITYQEQLQAGQEANAEYLKDNPYGLPKPIVIELDVDKEYQAREQQKAKQ
jgi:hypothetical protein